MVLVWFVYWHLQFVRNDGKKIFYERHEYFDSKEEAREFVNHAPQSEFQCKDFMTGEFGNCRVNHFTIRRKRK